MRSLPRRFRARLAEALGAGEPPRRLAAAWAVGVGIGLSPLLGVQTLVALAVALLFRLNKVDVLLGTLIINPWTLTVYFPAAVLLGERVAGLSVPRLVLPQPAALLDLEFWRSQRSWLEPLMISWWTGAAVLALAGSLVTYYGLRALIIRHRTGDATVDG